MTTATNEEQTRAAARELLQQEQREREEADRRNPVLPSTKRDAYQAADIILQRYFIKENFWTFVHFQETWYSYYRQQWSERTDDDIDYFIHDKLQRCRCIDSEGDLQPYPTTREVVNEIKFQIKQMVGIPSHMSPPILMEKGKWIPQDVKGKMICKGKIVDMMSGKVFSNHALFIPNGADWDYDAKAPKPKHWMAFLKSLNQSELAIELIREWMGYVLSGDLWAQKGLLMIGPRRSGKGTIGHILSMLLGKSMVASPTLAALGKDFGLQPLVNKRLCLMSDARLGTKADVMAVVEILLRLIAADALDINRKHKSILTSHQLPARVMMLSNEMPPLADTSNAINSRFLIVKLTESFFGREDHELLDKLKPELPGIANWAMQGYRNLIKRGRFIEPSESDELREEWYQDNNPTATFFEECLAFDKESTVRIKELYDLYCQWCEDNKHMKCSPNFFSRRLSTMAGSNIRRFKGEGGERRIQGIKITNQRF